MAHSTSVKGPWSQRTILEYPGDRYLGMEQARIRLQVILGQKREDKIGDPGAAGNTYKAVYGPNSDNIRVAIHGLKFANDRFRYLFIFCFGSSFRRVSTKFPRYSLLPGGMVVSCT